MQDKRKRGIIILTINLFGAIIWAYYGFSFNRGHLILASVYLGLSILFLIKRIMKKQELTQEQKSNYIFGEKLGAKMKKVTQKFIMEAMMISYCFLILASVSGIFLTLNSNVSLWIKVTGVVGGIFGALLMLMFLITTFQSYKMMNSADKITEMIKEIGTPDFLK